VEILDLNISRPPICVPCFEDDGSGWGARALLGLQWIGGDDSCVTWTQKSCPATLHRARSNRGLTLFFVYEGSIGCESGEIVANGGGYPTSEGGVAGCCSMVETLQQSPGYHRVEAQLLVHEAGVVARPLC